MKKWQVIAAGGVQSLYLACVVAFSVFLVLPSLSLTLVAIVLLTPAFYFLQKRFAEKCPSLGPRGLRRERDKLSWQIFAVVSGVIFAAMLLGLAAHYPGVTSGDIVIQWNQVQTGKFDDWHPAIHTMLIWLVTRVVNRLAFFLAVQMLCFSLLAGWMAASLRAWGLGRGWVAAFAVILLAPRSTQTIFLNAFKDTALIVLLLALAVQTINIVLSDAAWLRKWPNRIAFALVLGLATLMRHNGMFFTIPLLGLLLVFYAKKHTRACVTAALLAVLVILGIRGPLYSLARVNRGSGEFTQALGVENQTYEEAVGLPMTILCSVYSAEPGRLDPEIRAWMRAAAPEFAWDFFVFGSYNSIKPLIVINRPLQNMPLGQLLRMTCQTVRAAPETSLRAALALTHFVWSPFLFYSIDYSAGLDPQAFAKEALKLLGEEEAPYVSALLDFYMEQDDLPNSLSEQKAAVDGEKVEAIAGPYRVFRRVVELLTPDKILQSKGVNMLALALAGAYSLRRRRGLKALLLVAPSMAYNIGTMLMLSGGDHRFFQFNAVITLPLVLICLAREEKKTTSESRDCD